MKIPLIRQYQIKLIQSYLQAEDASILDRVCTCEYLDPRRQLAMPGIAREVLVTLLYTETEVALSPFEERLVGLLDEWEPQLAQGCGYVGLTDALMLAAENAEAEVYLTPAFETPETTVWDQVGAL